ncbi:MAG: helix-turn-helix domain-containing protein, partial [Clostridiaceae bacterium]|nr:helix-turn-helix domain-containing protein [Clostridiaceae bacterium]
DHAKSLLKHSDHTIGEIATFSGFHSSSYFSQIFKKRVEMSPSDYRNSNLANE